MSEPLNLTIGSLFSGIGGLELGLEWAGVGHTIWQVEQNEYCRAVLAKHWPDATRYEDVRNVGRANLVPVDVICGGFPCQDISYAGPGLGLAGARSGLWYEYARIIGELEPAYAVVENVAALLDRGMGDVLGTLSDLGYDAEWSVVPVCAMGGAHMRQRVFVVAYSRRARLSRRGERGEPCETRQPRREEQPRGFLASALWLHNAAPELHRGDAGLPHRVDRIHALGNAVVPQVAEVVGRVIVALESQRLALPTPEPSHD